MRKLLMTTLLVAVWEPLMAITPPQFEQMEIETKWEVTAFQFEEIVRFLASAEEEQREVEGLTPNTRWGGRCGKFIDLYYDADSQLANAGHSLRKRIFRRLPQKSAKSVRLISGGLTPREELDQEVGEEQVEWNWVKLQYKSDAYRYGDVWFRQEIGSKKLKRKEVRNLINVLEGETEHPSTKWLRRDHGDDFFLKHRLKPCLEIVNYRHRVVLERGDSKLFEVSMDRLVHHEIASDGTVGEAGVETYEVEIEILNQPNEARVRELYDLTAALRERFKLVATKTSKAGNIGDRYGLVGIKGQPRGWFRSVEAALQQAGIGATVLVEPAVYHPVRTLSPGSVAVQARSFDRGGGAAVVIDGCDIANGVVFSGAKGESLQLAGLVIRSKPGFSPVVDGGGRVRLQDVVFESGFSQE